MADYKAYTVRLDPLVGEEYEKLADNLGLKPAEYLRDVLTNGLYVNTIKNEVARVENLINDHEASMRKVLEKFTVDNQFNEKFYEDIGGLYMMMLGALMQLKIEKDDIRGMQAKGVSYAHNNFLGKVK